VATALSRLLKYRLKYNIKICFNPLKSEKKERKKESGEAVRDITFRGGGKKLYLRFLRFPGSAHSSF
jgi:hypothetical protein